MQSTVAQQTVTHSVRPMLLQNMGLGKSLTCIALLHALMHNRLLRRVLLVAPTNVISHWENEVDKWTGQLPSPISVLTLGSVQKGARQQEVNRWQRRGGIVLVSNYAFVALTKIDNFAEPLLNADVIVVDEAHVSKRVSQRICVARWYHSILRVPHSVLFLCLES